MAKTTAKRKSDGDALPTAKSRKSAQESSPHAASDGLFVGEEQVAAKHVKKRGRKSEPAGGAKMERAEGELVNGEGGVGWNGQGSHTAQGSQGRRDDEYDEDIGRTESNSFLALVQFETQKKRKTNKENRGFMEKFESVLDGREAELKLALAEGEKASTKRDSQFLESFKAAYDMSRGQGTDKVQDFAANYKKSQDIVSTAYTLVAKFEEVSKRVTEIDIAALLENEWASMDGQARDILLTGKNIGVARYKRILAASEEDLVLDGEADKAADALYGPGGEYGGWGKTAKKQEKALKKLVKTVEG